MDWLLISGSIGLVVYIGSHVVVRIKASKQFIVEHQWLYPNKISWGGALLGWISIVLYFIFKMESLGIFLFVVSWALDGADGIVARGCGLGSERGKELDPLMDKLKYFFALGFIYYYGGIYLAAFLWFLLIDFSGQFVVRPIIKKYPHKFKSVAATIIGKIKTNSVNLFIVLFFYLHSNMKPLELMPKLFYILIILAVWSIASKMLPRRAM